MNKVVYLLSIISIGLFFLGPLSIAKEKPAHPIHIFDYGSPPTQTVKKSIVNGKNEKIRQWFIKKYFELEANKKTKPKCIRLMEFKIPSRDIQATVCSSDFILYQQIKQIAQ